MASEASSVFSFVGNPGPSPSAQAQEPAYDSAPPDMESLVLSLKLMVSAGTAFAFHVGGYVDEDAVPEVPGWNSFIGDRCGEEI